MSEVSRLRWRCRRGMKELDVVLTAWLDRHYSSASDAEKNEFLALLEMDDPDLAALLLGGQRSDIPERDRVVQRIRHSAAP